MIIFEGNISDLSRIKILPGYQNGIFGQILHDDTSIVVPVL
jgi:hypothetical protein